MNGSAFLAAFALILLLIALLLVMLLTGYMPAHGFGKNPAHAARFGLVFGVACGLGLALAFSLWDDQ